MAQSDQPVTIKLYANQRLYNVGTGSYVTAGRIRAMMQSGQDVTVFDAQTGADMTRLVLHQDNLRA